MSTKMTRRVFLATTASCMAAAGSNRLSITVRIAEAPGSNQKTILGFEELVELAKKIGYGAIDMRASQAGVETRAERQRQMRGVLDSAG